MGCAGMQSMILGAGDGPNGDDQVRKFAGKPVAHHPTVGNPRGKDPPIIDGVVLLQLPDESPDEPDVVYPVLVGPGAAIAGIPGEEPVLPEPRAVGVDGDEALLVRLPAEARHFCHLFSVAAPAMKDEDHGPGLVLAVGCRQVDEVRSIPAVMAQRKRCVFSLDCLSRTPAR